MDRIQWIELIRAQRITFLILVFFYGKSIWVIILFLDSDFTIFLLMVPPKILIAYINLSRSSVVDYNDNNNIKSKAQVLSDIHRFYSFSIALLIVWPDGFGMSADEIGLKKNQLSVST